jgi:hypothetical protein
LKSGDLPGSLEAARRAVAIDPAAPYLQTVVSRLYQTLGDQEKAALHARYAQRLAQVKDRDQK